MQRSIKCVEAG